MRWEPRHPVRHCALPQAVIVSTLPLRTRERATGRVHEKIRLPEHCRYDRNDRYSMNGTLPSALPLALPSSSGTLGYPGYWLVARTTPSCNVAAPFRSCPYHNHRLALFLPQFYPAFILMAHINRFYHLFTPFLPRFGG